MTLPANDGASIQAALEVLAATGSALVAGYVRARGEPCAWHWRAVLARLAEAVVCGLISVGVSTWMGWTDARLGLALSAGVGLIGTQALTDLVVRVFQKRVGG